MAALKGRTLVMTWGGATPTGAQEKSVEMNGAPIDITSDDDAGWRALMSVSAQDEVNVTLSGVTKDNNFKNDWYGASGGSRTKTLVLTYPDGSVMTGTFFLAAYTEKANYKDAVTYEATFNSTGVVGFTPGS